MLLITAVPFLAHYFNESIVVDLKLRIVDSEISCERANGKTINPNDFRTIHQFYVHKFISAGLYV